MGLFSTLYGGALMRRSSAAICSHKCFYGACNKRSNLLMQVFYGACFYVTCNTMSQMVGFLLPLPRAYNPQDVQGENNPPHIAGCGVSRCPSEHLSQGLCRKPNCRLAEQQ